MPKDINNLYETFRNENLCFRSIVEDEFSKVNGFFLKKLTSG